MGLGRIRLTLLRHRKGKGHKSRASALHVTQIDASMRLNYTSARPFWRNGHHVVQVRASAESCSQKATELASLHTVQILHSNKGLALTSTTLVTENVSSGDVKSTFLVAACAAATSRSASAVTRILHPERGINIISVGITERRKSQGILGHQIAHGVLRINQHYQAPESSQCPPDRAGSPDRAGPRLIAPARLGAWDSTHRGARGSAAAGREQDHPSRDGVDGAAGIYGDSIRGALTPQPTLFQDSTSSFFQKMITALIFHLIDTATDT